MPSRRVTGDRGELRALRWDVWGSGQWLLAGCHVVSGSRDVSARRSGLYLNLQPVLPEHPEEEHIQHLWTATGYWRPAADGGPHAVPCRLGFGEGDGLLRPRGLAL